MASLLPQDAHPLDAMAVILPVVAASEPERFVRTPAATLGLARRLLRMLAAAPALPASVESFRNAQSTYELSSSVLVAFGRKPDPDPVHAIRAALILCADQGIDDATVAARVAAGTGADVYACLSAALAAFSGPASGRGPERVQAMIREIGSLDRVASVVRDRLSRGDGVPGFGQSSYPDGDPRAGPLFELSAVAAPDALTSMVALRDTMSLVGQRPNLDFALVALAEALSLPAGAATFLLALGRVAGWIAHVLEQRETGAPLAL